MKNLVDYTCLQKKKEKKKKKKQQTIDQWDILTVYFNSFEVLVLKNHFPQRRLDALLQKPLYIEKVYLCSKNIFPLISDISLFFIKSLKDWIYICKLRVFWKSYKLHESLLFQKRISEKKWVWFFL